LRPFGEAESILLQEARARCDFEQRSATALTSKSNLFLTISGVSAALVGNALWRLLTSTVQPAQRAAIGSLLLCLALLTVTAILLARSALSSKYQVLASPRLWLDYLTTLRRKEVSLAEDKAIETLQWSLLDAWGEAAEAWTAANESKARILHRAAVFLVLATALAFVGVALLVLPSLLG
jgi:hypothetical protein